VTPQGSNYCGLDYYVDRERDQETGFMTGLWKWVVTQPGTGKVLFKGTEASQATALNAAQEQCGSAPLKRSSVYVAVPLGK
jgi:hypothetical protein